jgi:thiol-disulfide isomerase/thioredoxin
MLLELPSLRPLIVFLPLVFVIAACDRQSDAPPQAKAAVNTAEEVVTVRENIGKLVTDYKGAAAPDVVFESPDGSPVKLGDFKGKPLLVNLWATWCAPCVAEMPTLDTLATTRGDALRVLTVSMDLEGRRAVDPFFAKAKLQHLDAYLDKKNDLMLALRTDTLPTTILYDSRGREVWRMIGGMDWTGTYAGELIDRAK